MTVARRDIQRMRRMNPVGTQERLDSFHEKCKQAGFKTEHWRQLLEDFEGSLMPQGGRLKARLGLALGKYSEKVASNQYTIAFPESEYGFPLFLAFEGPEVDALFCDFVDLPLYLGSPITEHIAAWRLERGK